MASLGIMTLYLNDAGALEERDVYRRMVECWQTLRKQGKLQQISDLFVFTPDDVSSDGRVRAHVYSQGSWSRAWRPFPALIFDRCRLQQSARFARLQQFRRIYKGRAVLLNRILRNKWTVYELLRSDAMWRPHLPETKVVRRWSDVRQLLAKHRLLYVKPVAGTGGRGIIRLELQGGGRLIGLSGRAASRRIVKPRVVRHEALAAALAPWGVTSERQTYLAQQGLWLTLPDGRVHDYRLLAQKNGYGQWSVTGIAGRIGARGSITANLHGGGQALRADALLKRAGVHDAARREHVLAEASRISLGIAQRLEREYGRLCELALDLAIDASGHIWLLEVNPKPAREVFRRTHDAATYERALTRPLEYANYLALRETPSSKA